MHRSSSRNRTGSGTNQNLRSTAQLLRVYRAQAKRLHRRLVSAGPEKLRLLGFLFALTTFSFIKYFYFTTSSAPVHHSTNPFIVHVSTSTIDIVPHDPVPLSGFATRKSPPISTTLLTPWAPLRARVLTIRFTNTTTNPRLVLITLDIIGISRNISDTIFDELLRTHGLARKEVRIVCSHTHSGPAVMNTLSSLLPRNTNMSLIARYTEQLTHSIVTLVGNALTASTKAEPSHMYQSSGNLEIGVNRGEVRETEFSERTNRGNVDSEVPVLWFRQITGKKAIIAGMYGMAAHATILTTNNQYSGDYPSAVSTALETQFPGSVWFYMPGCGGDINIYPRGTVELLQLHRDIIVGEVRRVVEMEVSMTPLSGNEVVLKHTELAVPFRTRIDYNEMRKYARNGDPTTQKSAEKQLGFMRPGDRTKVAYEFPMSLWSIGRLNILFLGGEPTVGYASVLRSVEDVSWVVGYTDDVMGYVGTASVLRGKTREGSDRAALYYGLPCAWDPIVERLIVEKSKELCADLESSQVLE